MDPRRSRDQESGSLMPMIILMLVALFGWQYYQSSQVQPSVEVSSEVATQAAMPNAVDALGAPAMVGAVVQEAKMATPTSARVPVESELVYGSVALTGGRLDELSLAHYLKEMGAEDNVTIFAPSGYKTHFFDAGWQSATAAVPTGNTVWQTNGSKLSPSTPLVLSYENAAGQTFTRTFTMEKDGYTVRIVDEVINRANMPITLGHYAQIHKVHDVDNSGGLYSPEQSTFYNFLGPLAMIDDIKYEHDYEDVKQSRIFTHEGVQGWVGMKSRYFLAALIPDQQNDEIWKVKYSRVNGQDFYSTIVQMPNTVSVAANGGTYTKSYRVYAGPNIRAEMAKESVGLEESVDYGWFHFIALPIFKMLMWFDTWVHNLGVAIILGTIVLKLILFPLANRSYAAMAKMKKLQPELLRLREKHGDNREAAAMDMMNLYKKYKVNPMSGCWPMLIQVPIFFAFYKVILVSFEFRHAPFMGHIVDLSEKDPYFILPILMGATMYIQQMLNPSSGDPMQDKVMKLLPVIFTAMFLFFPAGLVLYWTVNNVFSITQQYIIMKRLETSK